ncbi:MAG: bacillithiol biosynthesis cysteine-adding enzyme BshC [Acidobacteriota bacterium]|nr:bacillithiol biosynthesis cysteine-adding enzyme BshC [Acidobacteriota bacterium]
MTSSRCISLKLEPKATPLFLDYLYHYDRVARFYGGSPHEFASYQRVASAIEGLYPHRAELAAALLRQNQALGGSEKTIANIHRLEDPKTFAVVAGQQVGLFSGPAFTLYKALTAVRVAATLSEQGLSAVPVFWLATEDHDLAEVAQNAVLNESGSLIPFEVAGNAPAPGCSVGYIKLADQVDQALAAVEGSLPPGEARERLMSDLRECYAPGTRWGEAFGRFMGRLFGRFGVILIDPLEEAFHRLTSGLYFKSMRDAAGIRRLLQSRSQELTAAGYHAQVHVSDDSTLVFAAVKGARTAVRSIEGGFRAGDISANRAEMEAWVESRPIEFTPSALLRPIVQDTLLPTIAYIPGPSELAYYAQSQSIYAEYGRPMPVLYPRASFTIASGHTQRLLEKYHLALEDVWKDEEHLRRRIAAAAATGDGSWPERIDEGEKDLKELFDQIESDAGRIDPTLLDAVKNTREKVLYQIERLRGKMSRAALAHSDLLARHERTIQSFLMPGGNLQERAVGGVSFLGRTGYSLLDDLMGQIHAECMDHQYIVF